MQEEQKISQNIEPEERCNPKYMPLPSDNLDDFEIVGDIEAGQAIKASIRYFKSVVAGSPQDDILESVESVTAKMIFNHMKLNIDRALKEYFTNHKNGKKGGAPKGNQNARKKKRPEPEQEPEEVAEDLTDEAEPVPDPDPEPDREPEPDEPLVIDSFIEWRIAKMFQELYRKPNNFADFHGEQLAELLAYMAISGSFVQWLEQVNELDTLDAVRELSKREFGADTPDKDYEAEFMGAKDAALNIIQYSIDSILAAIEEYNELKNR